MRRMIQEYGRIYARLDDQIRALQAEIAAAEGMPVAGMNQATLARLQALRAQVYDEVTRFGGWADIETSARARQAMEMGIKSARGKALAYGVPAVASSFTMLPVEAVEMMAGFLGPASPLHTALARRLGIEVAADVEAALVDAVALGHGPRVAARVIRDVTRQQLGKGLTWAMSTSRTAIIWAHREAERASYVANADMIPSYVRMSARDGRVCMACLALDGQVFPAIQPLNDHYNGRCFSVPVLRGEPFPDTGPNGREWFEAQDWTFQREMMGPAKYAAWKAGEFDFRQLAGTMFDSVYGEITIEASLKGILGDKAVNYYKRAA